MDDGADHRGGDAQVDQHHRGDGAERGTRDAQGEHHAEAEDAQQLGEGEKEVRAEDRAAQQPEGAPDPGTGPTHPLPHQVAESLRKSGVGDRLGLELGASALLGEEGQGAVVTRLHRQSQEALVEVAVQVVADHLAPVGGDDAAVHAHLAEVALGHSPLDEGHGEADVDGAGEQALAVVLAAGQTGNAGHVLPREEHQELLHGVGIEVGVGVDRHEDVRVGPREAGALRPALALVDLAVRLDADARGLGLHDGVQHLGLGEDRDRRAIALGPVVDQPDRPGLTRLGGETADAGGQQGRVLVVDRDDDVDREGVQIGALGHRVGLGGDRGRHLQR